MMPVSQPAPEALLERVEWTVLRRLEGALQGDSRTLFTGSGVEFADLREYQHGDDVRRIDWNATARLANTYVRDCMEERQFTAWFLLDLSASLDFGSQYVAKRVLAQDFFALVARLLTRQGNRIGALLYGDAVDTVIQPGRGRNHVMHVLKKMLARPEHKGPGTTDLKELLGIAARVIRGRSLVFVVSDFISAPGWTDLLAGLALRHDMVSVRLFDPLEIELPDIGLIAMQDAETGERLFVDTHDKRFRDRYATAARKRELELNLAFSKAGVQALNLSTSEDLVDAIMRYARSRKQQAQFRHRAAAGPSPRVAA
jgi:uncharacterized protein (DUF58 family)